MFLIFYYWLPSPCASLVLIVCFFSSFLLIRPWFISVFFPRFQVSFDGQVSPHFSLSLSVLFPSFGSVLLISFHFQKGAGRVSFLLLLFFIGQFDFDRWPHSSSTERFAGRFVGSDGLGAFASAFVCLFVSLFLSFFLSFHCLHIFSLLFLFLIFFPFFFVCFCRRLSRCNPADVESWRQLGKTR